MTEAHLLPRDASARWWSAIARRSLRGPADWALVVLDAVVVCAAYAGMLVVRFELSVPSEAWPELFRFLPIAIAVHLIANRLGGLYGPVWQQASVEEAQRILVSGGVAGVLLFAGVWVGPRLAPLSVVLTGAVFTTAFVGLLRFQSRLFAFRRRLENPTRVLVVGAGESGGALLRELSRKSDAQIEVVALLDDDPRKLGRWLGGVPITGQLEDVVEVGSRLQVDQVLLAIPSADSALVRRVADATAELGVSLKVLPTVSELMNGQPQLRDVRDLAIEDLLGRQSVSTDLASVEALIRGRRVLVTGGGGSIGSEIVRQVAQYRPARLVVVDRDETNLFDAVAAAHGGCRPVLLDLRNERRLQRLLHEERPEIVFHAAADKHVPLLEAQPAEAASNNVLGTRNLVAACRELDVAHFVFVSTDKAVSPTSVMGASKRLGEQLVLADVPQGSSWCAVRFGNVLGSRGSVVPTFMRQIREGGPVTLTHPDMTRYFMSVPEAVQLVLQASALAEDSEVFLLDMGEPVRIMDLAQRMISLAGYRVGVDVRIEVTGVRPGEKLSEELFAEHEQPTPTSHPKIMRLHPAVPAAAEVASLVQQIAEAVLQDADDRIRELLLGGGDPPRVIYLDDAATAATVTRPGRASES